MKLFGQSGIEATHVCPHKFSYVAMAEPAGNWYVHTRKVLHVQGQSDYLKYATPTPTPTVSLSDSRTLEGISSPGLPGLLCFRQLNRNHSNPQNLPYYILNASLELRLTSKLSGLMRVIAVY